ncbi:MAG: cupin domain-containing protein [Sulfurifustaceae bacterium]
MTIVYRFKPETEFYTDERCHIVEIQNDESPDCSVARARVEPGVTTRRHALRDSTERYVILTGEGMVQIGDDAPIAVGPFDIVKIPPGTSQRITNTGSADLVFLCICTPPFRQDRYIDLEK